MPANATSNSKLPVVVYIQGGGYMINSTPYVNGSALVENSGHNLIFVSLNYRVGLWGFLSAEDVKNNGILNTGLRDQRFLLNWVQTHISKVRVDLLFCFSSDLTTQKHHLFLHLLLSSKQFRQPLTQGFSSAETLITSLSRALLPVPLQ
jgi:hypothetical protein